MDLKEIIVAVGYLGVFAIVFSESGLLIGIFFPGDSLLFTAGFLASQGVFQVFLLALGSFLAAVLGDSTGYAFGRQAGKKFFNRPNSLFFNQDNVERARNFYLRHGGKTIILARFIPGIRTLAPIIAGVGAMKYSSFLAYNLLGGFFWAVGITLLGYYLGTIIPGVDKYLLLIVLVIVLISVAPAFMKFLYKKDDRRASLAAIKNWWQARH